ncbi:MAG: amino acid permease [Candidatus Koribacter versatilis]|uniref:Amino acid permease n=1 Tax=Candidatus Korobacter versatilis TaxID=658062 RepID=A0A932ENN4_9BACT|nr:amino acid permease [Candidatus Koribacter versatilis]
MRVSDAATPHASAQHGVLKRVLGPMDAAALVVSNVIGVGIFTTPGIIALLSPAPGPMLAAWLVGGLLAFAGAISYAQLAALRPHAGGEYVYLRAAFGPLAGFLTGWMSFVAGFSGAIAAGAVGFASYLSRYAPGMASDHPLLSVPLGLGSLDVSPRALVAIGLILILSLVHTRGLGPGRVVQNSLAGINLFALLVLIVGGFVFGRGATAHFHEAAGPVPPAAVHFGAWLVALIPVMFTYSGWNAAAYVAEEVREPERNVPRALAGGTLLVIVLYLALNALYLYAIPMAGMAGKPSAGDAAAEALFGPRGANALVPIIMVALAAGISAMIVAGPRVYFAMARDGLFFPAAGRVHPRFHTPAASILAQALWSSLLVLTGTFEQLLIYTGFAVVLFSAVATAALFVLRSRPHDERVPRWGYPVAPALFIVASLAMLVSSVMREPKPSAAGVGIMVAGVPLFFLFRHRHRSRPRAHQKL